VNYLCSWLINGNGNFKKVFPIWRITFLCTCVYVCQLWSYILSLGRFKIWGRNRRLALPHQIKFTVNLKNVFQIPEFYSQFQSYKVLQTKWVFLSPNEKFECDNIQVSLCPSVVKILSFNVWMDTQFYLGLHAIPCHNTTFQPWHSDLDTEN
jgi:hypothetical protein